MAKNLILDQILFCFAQIWAPNFFLRVLPQLVITHCSKLLSYGIQGKTKQPNLRKWKKKKKNWAWFWPVLVQIYSQKIVFWGFYLHCMLYIVASYHSMQFQGELMDHIWENNKKPSFGPNFGPFGPKFCHNISFREFYLYQMLGIVATYHCLQF